MGNAPLDVLYSARTPTAYSPELSVPHEAANEQLYPIPRRTEPVDPQDLPAGPHPVILVGSNCSETRLLKHKGFEVLLCILLAVFSGIHIDNVEAGLVSVHGVENDLEDRVGGSAAVVGAGPGSQSEPGIWCRFE